MLDLAIRNGLVIDGTGAPARRADVGIRAGTIVEIGRIDEPARRTIDAEGQVVTPGFIDPHTHYDAQVFWDPLLTPSAVHGVTTVVAGNCGFGIAPLTAADADYLIRMLAKVEGMPLAALQAGVPWDWGSNAEYLDRVDSLLGINAAFMAGHSTIRRAAMGPAANERAATEAELDAMEQLLRAALDAGCIGFSSSWGDAHRDGDGGPVPSKAATEAELLHLAALAGTYTGTSLEFLPPVGAGAFEPDDAEFVARLSAAARRPLNWNVMQASAANLDVCLHNLEAGSRAEQLGGKVVALVMPVPALGRFSFHHGFVLDALPGWGPVMGLPVPERIRALSDPAVRAQLDADARQPGRLRHVAEWGDRLINQTFTPDTAPHAGRIVSDIAAEQGKSDFDALLDIVCADGLRTTFTRVVPPDTPADWEARLQVWRDPRTVLGASDAGAHLDYMATFNYTTTFLASVVREEQVLSLEEAVHHITQVPAALYGMTRRGVLAPGNHADLVIFDPDEVGSEPVVVLDDLPGGACRLAAGSTGISWVLVAGEPVVIGGQPTAARPGRVLRRGTDTVDPSLS